MVLGTGSCFSCDPALDRDPAQEWSIWGTHKTASPAPLSDVNIKPEAPLLKQAEVAVVHTANPAVLPWED